MEQAAGADASSPAPGTEGSGGDGVGQAEAGDAQTEAPSDAGQDAAQAEPTQDGGGGDPPGIVWNEPSDATQRDRPEGAAESADGARGDDSETTASSGEADSTEEPTARMVPGRGASEDDGPVVVSTDPQAFVGDVAVTVGMDGGSGGTT